MTTSEMRAAVEAALAARGMTMPYWKGLVDDIVAALATPSVASPQAEMSQQEEISWSAFCAEEAAKCFDALQADGMLTDREYFTGYIGGSIEDGFNIWKAKRAASVEALSAEGGAILKDLHIPSPSQQASGEHRADSKQTSASPVGEPGRTPDGLDGQRWERIANDVIDGGTFKRHMIPESRRELKERIVDALVRANRAAPPAQGAPGTRDGVSRIAAERKRQTEVEGWTPQHDLLHDQGELALAAACYATPGIHYKNNQWPPPSMWPWEKEWWKPTLDPIRNLEKAGALIAAEIDRRLAQPGAPTKEGA